MTSLQRMRKPVEHPPELRLLVLRVLAKNYLRTGTHAARAQLAAELAPDEQREARR